uniref:CCHC-type domain-containing protein n=1 Tax=Bursaphelenchus xylophilus TaxID=6326 RepID=A0A1I7SKG4_BURXY
FCQYCNGGEHLEKDCHKRKDYLKQLREKALAARVNYKANRGSSIVPQIISAGPVEQEPQENSEVKITANCTINEIDSLREKPEMKSCQEPFTCSSFEELSTRNDELESEDLETLFAEPEISHLASKVHQQTGYTSELSKSAFMSWKHEKKGIIPSFEEILDNSVYEKWFSTTALEIKDPKVNVDIPKEDTFESFEKRNQLFAKIVPRVNQNIQIPDFDYIHRYQTRSDKPQEKPINIPNGASTSLTSGTMPTWLGGEWCRTVPNPGLGPAAKPNAPLESQGT